jgi:hypothetical protein
MNRIWMAALAGGATFLAGCEAPPAAAKAKVVAEQPKEKAAQKPDVTAAAPVEVQTTEWKGSGPLQTLPFTATAPEWHVQYASRPDAAHPDRAVELQVYVHRADSGRIVALAVNSKEPTQGNAAVQTSPGDYYLRIWASGPWSAEVTGLR